MSEERTCTLKYKLLALYETIDGKILEQFGFRIRNVTVEKIANYLYMPKDSSSLAVTRILFGVAMLFDIPDERGGATMMARWGDPTTCHFPLVPFITAVRMPYMALVYAALWFGALGIALGYKYHASSIVFVCCYWYLFIIEKSNWNNHSYLFGVLSVLLSFTDAHCFWSIDSFVDPTLRKSTVPYWNYFILKYQLFILYFMAGLKKGTAEWLTGYSVQNLGEHWVFSPFKLFLTVPQTDYLIVHWFVFAFDLTVAFWMMWARTRHLAMFFCALFHLMNSRLFSIGMFPWVCLATMPLFYPFDWPKTVQCFFKDYYFRIKNHVCGIIDLLRRNKIVKTNQQITKEYQDYIDNLIKDNPTEVTEEVSNDSLNEINENTLVKEEENCFKHSLSTRAANAEINSSDEVVTATEVQKITDVPEAKQKSLCREKKDKHYKMITIGFIVFHILTQAFLPFSHFITQGYNNWTNGLYGYSWDMMVHTWDTYSVVVKIIDNDKNAEFFIDPYRYAPNDRWTRHGDMLHQYAHCLRDNLMSQSENFKGNPRNALSKNISIYADVWCSLNGRFTQRMFDPKADLLTVSWSPFKPTSYLMPLLDEALDWRSFLHGMRQEVHSWHNASDVIFIADFPGYVQEKYIPTDLDNVTLTVLEGLVGYEPELSKNLEGHSNQLATGNLKRMDSGAFHKILNMGKSPAYYMYTFVNMSDIHINKDKPVAILPIAQELARRLKNMVTFIHIVISSILQTLVQVMQCQQVN